MSAVSGGERVGQRGKRRRLEGEKDRLSTYEVLAMEREGEGVGP